MAELLRLAEATGKHLLAKGWWLAAAESCTGGLFLSTLTDIEGSSAYITGGVVSYSNALKQGLLGVAQSTLEQHGAVSEECAREMALGICTLTGAHIGISITGIAGSGGGTPQKPAGLVYVGLAHGSNVQVTRHLWQGNRHENKASSVKVALERVLALA